MSPTDPQEREAAHSPLPWYVSCDEVTIYAPPDGNVAKVLRGKISGWKQKANAKLIVEAVNSYATSRKLADEVTRLREALKRIVALHKDGHEHHMTVRKNYSGAFGGIRNVAVEALAPQPKGGSQ